MTQIEPAAQSVSTPRPSRSPMQVVGERRVADPPTSLATPMTSETIHSGMRATSPPTNVTTEQAWATPANRAWRAGVLGAVNVLAMVLAGRLLVLVAIAGAIFLTWL